MHLGPRLTTSALAAVLLVSLVGSAPSATAAGEVHLTAAADYGARAETATVLNAVAGLQPDAHLALGDLAYQDVAPESAWCDFVKARVGEGFPFELVSGNHESDNVPDGAINNYSACLPNQAPGVVGTYGREYFMDFPRGAPLVRVIMVSPALTFGGDTWTYAAGDAHYSWVSAAIDDARAKGARWVVVSMHRLCLSVGIYSCPAVHDLYQLLLDKKVDLVLTGHEHSYMRTHQLRSGTTGCATLEPGTFNAACVADTDSVFTAGQGTVFATVGTGGTALRDIALADTEAGYFATSSGLNRDPTFGLLDVRLTDSTITARFVPTSGGTFTDAFTITRSETPPNQPPTASMAAPACTQLACTFDGSASTDPDGTIASYAWSFGDGSTGAGATATTTYTAAGTYPVTLTVTDNLGASGSVTRNVTVGTSTPLALDTFSRTVTGGWGTAETGGAWTTTTPTALSVSGGTGVLGLAAPGLGRAVSLKAVSTASADVQVTVSSDKAGSGSGIYVSVMGRMVSGAGDYRVKARIMSTGTVGLSLVRTGSTGAETTIGSEVMVAGLTHTPGTALRVRLQVTGSAPTVVRARLWKAGSAEPTVWAVSATDSTAGLQRAGSFGVFCYLSGAATNAPVTLRWDDLQVVPAG